MEIKGYVVASGYMGYINGKYQLFATENDYLEAIADLILAENK